MVHDLNHRTAAARGERERPRAAGAVRECPVVRGRDGIAKDQRADAAARAEIHRAVRGDVERAEVRDGIHAISDKSAGPVRGGAPRGVRGGIGPSAVRLRKKGAGKGRDDDAEASHEGLFHKVTWGEPRHP